MCTTVAKIQILRQTVEEILESIGFSRIFNEQDFSFLERHSRKEKNRAEWITKQFLEWNIHELSDFAEYEY